MKGGWKQSGKKDNGYRSDAQKWHFSDHIFLYSPDIWNYVNVSLMQKLKIEKEQEET